MAISMMILAVAAILTATGCSKHKSSIMVEPDTGVGQVTKGMNNDQVEAAIGKPEKINGMWWYYRRRGMIIGFGKMV